MSVAKQNCSDEEFITNKQEFGNETKVCLTRKKHCHKKIGKRELSLLVLISFKFSIVRFYFLFYRIIYSFSVKPHRR